MEHVDTFSYWIGVASPFVVGGIVFVFVMIKEIFL